MRLEARKNDKKLNHEIKTFTYFVCMCVCAKVRMCAQLRNNSHICGTYLLTLFCETPNSYIRTFISNTYEHRVQRQAIEFLYLFPVTAILYCSCLWKHTTHTHTHSTRTHTHTLSETPGSNQAAWMHGQAHHSLTHFDLKLFYSTFKLK